MWPFERKKISSFLPSILKGRENSNWSKKRDTKNSAQPKDPPGWPELTL